MGKTQFTVMQQAAIDTRNKNILVSAAAGSGKTSVLVERIIERVLDDNNPVDIDRILVMTFTRAAAAQMKEKILNAINEKRNLNPGDKNLNKQYTLVHNANIMTIDSFCMGLVRNHFGEINLSPDFRMADEGEMRLLQQDVLESVLEDMYENGSEEFLKMTEIFASKKSDSNIEDLVLSLYKYAQSYPDPSEWLDGCTKEYTNENSVWLDQFVKRKKKELNNVRRILDEAGDLCTSEYGPLPYLENIEADIEFIDSLSSFNTYEELYDKCVEYTEYKFSALKRVASLKEGQASEEEIAERSRLKDRVQEMRNAQKKAVTDLITTVSVSSPEDIKNGMLMMASPVNELVSLVKVFTDAFNNKKRERNIVDFNDIEHMCLEILKKGEDTTAAEYREFFDEIYVDEYQDSNFVQEEILNLIAKRDENIGNVFMVGDVKQSIYGFRMAKPELFVNKYNRFDTYPTEGKDVRIDLSDNFRSRREVLASVNNLFMNIMDTEHGGIEYDNAAALHPGKEYIDTGIDYTTELNLLIKDEDADDKTSEALMVAGRIKELVKNGLIEKDGEARRIKYSDIVILLRTGKGWDNIFMRTLEEQGIPVFVTSSTGYFESMEIRTILNFLKVIDNPLQDIPLAAVMMSVIGNFSEEETAIIRGAFREGYLYEALNSYFDTYCSEEDEAGSIGCKIKEFLNLIDYYRKKAEYTAVSDILTEIIDGDYGRIIKAMPGGAKRYANLNMLLKKALEYGKTSYKGIFHFNRYIEAIRKYDIDYGEANISDENDDTVRIMSIHKSKGLEFPICFLCGMNKGFNMMDTRAAVLTDSAYGIATDVIDVNRRIKTKSLFKTVVAWKKQDEIIAEEMRVLYVAMTRAKEKLIMTGVVKDENVLTDALVTSEKAKSYLDLYTCAADRGLVEGINLKFINVEELIDDAVAEAVETEVNRNRVLSIIYGKDYARTDSGEADKGLSSESDEADAENAASDRYMEEMIRNRLEFEYPYEDRGAVKLSVSELKHKSDKVTDAEAAEDNEVTKHLYDGYEPGQVSKGALHGTAVHRMFEIWDYNRPATEESVDEFLGYVKDEGLIEEELYELVRKDEIMDFISSDIAARMGEADRAGELFREQPFVICHDPDNPESMLIQGIIDAYFIEDGKIVLVDYKTDRGKSEKQLVEDHGTQLGYYAEALKRLLHMEIKESVIYSTFLKKSICI